MVGISRHIHSCLPAILGMALVACGAPKDDRALKAMSAERGMTEQQVLALAGQPSRIEKADFCQRDGGVREMVYERVLVDRLGLFSDQVVGGTVICLDGSGVVVSTHLIDH